MARGRLVAGLTADDFVELMAEELSALARMIQREQRRESQTRQV